jgi:murein DD-endopeptidase MepM/ murein hydrolase activator NlpD
MNKPSFSVSIKGKRHTVNDESPRPRPFLLRLVTWCMSAVWRTCVDWRTKRPFLTRATAHLSIIALALIAIFLSGVGIPAPQAAGGSSFDTDVLFSPGIDSMANSPSNVGSMETRLVATPSPTPTQPVDLNNSSNADVVPRLPVLHTTFPERPRLHVITYIVQPGDNIFNIAARFDLSPNTVVWSNREGIMDAPWLLQQGLELFILPMDGVYHTVSVGETVTGIAAQYEVEPAALYNDWNDLVERESLRQGQLLVVPGGVGEDVEWEPPPRYPAPGPTGYSYGVCSGTPVSGPGAVGWFVYPTGSREISGWYFHDPRNPGHIGLDYRCRSGDPIYAADNGVVTIAGWNGGYGIMVQINHGNGFITRYGHFNQLAVGCGHAVYQGTLLGYCGSTGWSTGAHLHFEIRENGVPLDPQIYLP